MARYDNILEIEPNLDGTGLKIGIALSRFNQDVGEGLLAAATATLTRKGVKESDMVIVTVPGALELPLVLQKMARSGRFDALIALGAVIRGETYHFELVANESGSGITQVQLDTGIPIANGILTTDTDDQALARMEEKGRECARVAVEMATLEGARTLYLDGEIGSLEPGKWADIIVVNLDTVHETPKFALSDNNVYSQLVYAAKSADVRDVAVAGRFLMRDRELLTIDVPAVQSDAEAMASRIDRFLAAREENLVDKIVGIGGVEQQETFEVQVKVRLPDERALRHLLGHKDVNVIRESVRRQYDTYFLFDDPDKGHVRYREDNVIQPDGSLVPRYGLTLRGPTVERVYENSVILSRSRFSAVADRSLRFYREYFQPDRIKEVNKERRRWRVQYKGVDFEVNADRLFRPAYDDLFLEIKSRTWSAKDALAKAGLIGEMLEIMGVSSEQIVRKEYVDF